MMPSTSQVPGQSGYTANRPVVSTTTAAAAAAAAAAATAPDQRRQRYYESWVEVSSQPSSSSVSSAGDEIDTTGLQVGSSHRPRRRRPQQQSIVHVDIPRSAGSRHVGAGAGGSSQEEYDETESEEDHVLTSSNENMAVEHVARQTPLREVPLAQGLEFELSDDDENATALGMRPSEPFRPQPNAFTHPPSHLLHRHSTSSVFPHHGRRPSFTRRSQTRGGRRTPDFMSPNYQADNDAALRASLTTLLSCAAAARSLPKDGEKESRGGAGPVNSNQPVALRFAPESELLAPPPPPQPVPAASRGHAQAPLTRTASSTLPAPVTAEKNKRAAAPTSSSKPLRPTKKKRATISEDVVLSPTVMAWVISAGVVVLVSVVGFGAGYVFGREVGRQESIGNLASAGNASAIAEGGSCGREVLKTGGGTLRRFRWGSGIGRAVVA